MPQRFDMGKKATNAYLLWSLFLILSSLSCGDGKKESDANKQSTQQSEEGSNSSENAEESGNNDSEEDNSESDPPPQVDLNLILPESKVHFSNGDHLTINGSCISGSTITLTGSSTQQTTCQSGIFSFSVVQLFDKSAFFKLHSINQSTVSEPNYLTWHRDTIAPSIPAINEPTTHPYRGSEKWLRLEGSCEHQSTVFLKKSQEKSKKCQMGRFSFLLRQTEPGTYPYRVFQKDPAGNSSGSRSLTWSRDEEEIPRIALQSPEFTHAKTAKAQLNVEGFCQSGYEVFLKGDRSASTSCQEGKFQFTLETDSETQKTFEFQILQNNEEEKSAPQRFKWTFDPKNPPAPSLKQPVKVSAGAEAQYRSVGNIDIQGNCLPGHEINVLNHPEKSLLCGEQQSFQLHFQSACNEEKALVFQQKDQAGNLSNKTSLIWEKKCQDIPRPAITRPSNNPHSSNTALLRIQGSCESGMVVKLSGDVTASDLVIPKNSLVTTCMHSKYHFLIDKTENEDIPSSNTLLIHQQDRLLKPNHQSEKTQLNWEL